MIKELIDLTSIMPAKNFNNKQTVLELVSNYNNNLLKHLRIIAKDLIHNKNITILVAGSLARKQAVINSDLDLLVIGELDKNILLTLVHRFQELFKAVSVNFISESKLDTYDYKTFLSFLDAKFLLGNKTLALSFLYEARSYFKKNDKNFLDALYVDMAKQNLEPYLEFDIKTVAGGMREQNTYKLLNKYSTFRGRLKTKLSNLLAIRTVLSSKSKGTRFKYDNFPIEDFEKFRAKLLASLQEFALSFRQELARYLGKKEFNYRVKNLKFLEYSLDSDFVFNLEELDAIYFSKDLFKLREFKNLRCFAKYPSFHYFPVPYHCISTAKRIFELRSGKVYEKSSFFLNILNKLSKIDFSALVYASILHDIGKPKHKHWSIGANMIRERFSSKEKGFVERVAFIVENHLLIHHYASAKNIAQREVLQDFLTRVSVDDLDLIFLFTYLDMLASYNKVNVWYLEQYFILYRQLKRFVARNNNNTKMNDNLELNFEDGTISLNLRLKQDKVGLLYSVLQVISEFGGDIFYALIDKEGPELIDSFKIKHIVNNIHLKEKLNSVLSKNISLDYLGDSVDIKEFNIRQNSTYTILELKARDRENLLLDITRIFLYLDINIEFASISNIDQDAVDVFHLTKKGTKLRDIDIDDLKKLFYNLENVYDKIKILRTIEKSLSFIPVIDDMKHRHEDPIKILITILMSARTKDEVSAEASERLFARLPKLADLAKATEDELQNLIYPVGFYKTKAKHIKQLANILLKEFNSQVPDTLDDLLKLPGVGFKTATLALASIFDKDELCVDTHVHRISKYLGFTKGAKTPLDTHYILKRLFPSVEWQKINYILVSYGKTVCKPIAPRCTECKITTQCLNYKA